MKLTEYELYKRFALALAKVTKKYGSIQLDDKDLENLEETVKYLEELISEKSEE
jgi:hypothetical protein